MGELSHIASSSSQCSTHKEYYSECFYNKDGKWYYAGAYKAFRLDDLSVSEWEKPLTISFHSLALSDYLSYGPYRNNSTRRCNLINGTFGVGDGL